MTPVELSKSLNVNSTTSNGVFDPGKQSLIQRLQANISSVFLGKTEVVKLSMVALLAEGHLLLEDVPGVGKTLLAKAMAKSLDCTFHRIQFTPDLLPSDLLGTSVFHQPTGKFVFQPGPLFAQIILADEINRATPRTQSALLEAMSEHQVSLDGETRQLGPPFFVLGTQNPFEFEGTFPLPESQLDRFLIRTQIGYPDRTHEKLLMTQHRLGEPVDQLQPIVSVAELLEIQKQVRQVRIAEPLADYLLNIVESTRSHPDLVLGVSTRGLLALYRATQAMAILEGRDYGIPDDVKALVVPVLAHRILSKRWSQGSRDETPKQILQDILAQTQVPI